MAKIKSARDLRRRLKQGATVSAPAAGPVTWQFEGATVNGAVVAVSAESVRAHDRRRQSRTRAIADQERHRRTMVEYLQMMVDRQDWHGVMDAAADLREIDARLAILRSDAAAA